MKKQIAIEWAELLLSNPDLQGTGALNMNGRMCCLGVLCEKAIIDGVDVAVDQKPSDEGRVRYDNDSGGLGSSNVKDYSQSVQFHRHLYLNFLVKPAEI